MPIKFLLWDCNGIAAKVAEGCARNNANGTTLNAFVNNNDVLLSYPGEPTHIPSNGNTPSVVDLAFTSNIRDMGDMRTEATTSDHVAVIFEVGDTAFVEKRITVNDYSKANWLSFRRQQLEAHPIVNELNTVQDLDETVDAFTRNITEAIAQSIPRKTFNPNTYNELPPHILRHIADRNRERRAYQRTRDLVQKREKDLNREIKRMVAEHRDTTYTNRLRKINSKDGSIWKLNKHLRKLTDCVKSTPRTGQFGS
ncbi:hypothetical protein QE152_g1799 [Popillia japonica]|uniref:Endonuclease/exonuclease/phosphatase domain-containing protein n=1 Tax=Popillia japonica TaxID=7064 RepID=A0AAW1N2Z1_POPJA